MSRTLRRLAVTGLAAAGLAAGTAGVAPATASAEAGAAAWPGDCYVYGGNYARYAICVVEHYIDI